MESSLTNACTIKIENFEGPFDLLYHLIEKNQMNIYDIPISDITDQYMDYLYAMQQPDLEIASEFLLMASTLLHIKSRTLLPGKKEKQAEEGEDPREALVSKLLEYKKYKEFTNILKANEDIWANTFYKLPEVIEIKPVYENLELDPDKLVQTYSSIIERNRLKINKNSRENMSHIISHEKVSLKGKIREVVKSLLNKTVVKFSDLFSWKNSSRLEVATGFLAILELSRMKKVNLEQKKPFEDIYVYRKEEE